MFLRSFGLYCSACFGILFVSILYTCCSHFFWYCFISFTMFCAPVFPLIHWFFSLSNFVIPSKCLKNFICAASKRRSSLFFSSQASLPNFNAALAVMLWILKFAYSCYVHVFILLCMFCFVYSVSLCCSVYSQCVNVYCTTATCLSLVIWRVEDNYELMLKHIYTSDSGTTLLVGNTTALTRVLLVNSASGKD